MIFIIHRSVKINNRKIHTNAKISLWLKFSVFILSMEKEYNKAQKIIFQQNNCISFSQRSGLVEVIPPLNPIRDRSEKQQRNTRRLMKSSEIKSLITSPCWDVILYLISAKKGEGTHQNRMVKHQTVLHKIIEKKSRKQRQT